MTRLAALLLTCALPLAAQERPAPTITPTAPPRGEWATANPASPLSQYVRVGDMIWLSGMLGTRPGGTLAPGGIGPETTAAMNAIRSALARANATMDDVVKCTVFLADMREWGAMNAAYLPFFPTHRPARSAVAVQGLALDARVEIECIAVRGAGGR